MKEGKRESEKRSVFAKRGKMYSYTHDLSSLIDLNFSSSYSYSEEEDINYDTNHFLHDDTVFETSPLPFGMDWTPPPPNWDGPTNTLWPHNSSSSSSSWTFSSTIPSWLLVPQSTPSSDPVVVLYIPFFFNSFIHFLGFCF